MEAMKQNVRTWKWNWETWISSTHFAMKFIKWSWVNIDLAYLPKLLWESDLELLGKWSTHLIVSFMVSFMVSFIDSFIDSFIHSFPFNATFSSNQDESTRQQHKNIKTFK